MFSIRLSEEEANMRYSVSFFCVCVMLPNQKSLLDKPYFSKIVIKKEKKLGRKERTNKRGNVRKNQRRQ